MQMDRLRRNKMGKKAVPQFRFKPCAFWGHNVIGIRYIKQLFNCNRIKAEGHFPIAAFHPLFQFSQTPYSADKINPRVSPLIFYAQHRL